MVEIKIKQIQNGYIVESLDYNELEQKEIWNTYVFEIKEKNINFKTTKNEIEVFRDVVEFIENRLGLDLRNAGDYFLETKIKQFMDN